MPLTRRQVYRRRRAVVGAGAVLVLGAAFYLPLTLLAPVHALSADVDAYTAPETSTPVMTFPAYGASGIGAIGYPGVLASAGSAEALPIASISKIVTALVVLDAKPLALGEAGPDITFAQADVELYEAQRAEGGSVEPVFAGQVLSQRTAFDVMLMASANNYAESIAAWAFGSQAAFVDAARAWLTREGLTSTTFEEPTGVSPGNASTVGDLIELARRAIDNPVIAEIVATPALEVAGLGVIHNTNKLLGVNGVDGIKTGTLDEAGSCLLFSQDVTVGAETVTVIGVVLGGPDHATIDEAIRSLLAEADAGFHEVTLATEGEAYAEYETPWGDDAAAVAAKTVTVALWSATPVTLDADLDELALSKATAGTEVGKLTFTAGIRTVTVPLELDTTIGDPGPWWRLGNPGALF